MAGFLEQYAPNDLRQEKITVALADPRDIARPFSPIALTVALSPSILSVGLVLPVEMLITGPSASNFRRQLFRRLLPSRLSIQVNEGGSFLVLLRETAHNLHWGKLVINVEGDRLLG